MPKIDVNTIADSAMAGDIIAPDVGSTLTTAVFTDDTAKAEGTQTLTITLTDVDEAGTAYWVVVADEVDPGDAAAVITASWWCRS